jgi:hypothetical protein
MNPEPPFDKRLSRVSLTTLFLLILIFVYGCDSASAQLLNVESYRSSADTSKKWNVAINLGFEATKQEKSVLNATTGLQLYYNTKPWSVLLLNDLQLIRVESENVISSGYVHGRLGYWLRSGLALEGFGQYQYDVVRGLDNRWLTGGGLRINLVSKPNFSACLGSGFMYEYEQWQIENSSQVSINTKTTKLKSTNYISGVINLSDNLEFNLISYYQAQPASFFSPRLIADAQLEVEINRHLKLAIKWVSTYDADPILNSEPFIYSLSNSFIAEF